MGARMISVSSKGVDIQPLLGFSEPCGHNVHMVPSDAFTCLCGQYDRQGRATSLPPPSYTLAEIEQLARTYTTEAANRTTDELVLSLFLTWLAKREQGEVRGR